jgi:hypothetical protein
VPSLTAPGYRQRATRSIWDSRTAASRRASLSGHRVRAGDLQLFYLHSAACYPLSDLILPFTPCSRFASNFAKQATRHMPWRPYGTALGTVLNDWVITAAAAAAVSVRPPEHGHVAHQKHFARPQIYRRNAQKHAAAR